VNRQLRTLIATLVFSLAVDFPVQSADAPARADERAHFHHVRLNVRNVGKSMRFYQRIFGAVPVKYRDRADALFVERSFILFNAVDSAPDPTLDTGIWHIGWGGVDVRSEFEWVRKQDVPIYTPITPLPGRDNFYFYMKGPDGELIEINTMGHHRFGHVHLFATDVNATCRWYATHLGIKPRYPERAKPAGDMANLSKIWINVLPCDNVSIIVFGKPDIDPSPPWWKSPPLKTLKSTKGRPIDHMAFSYRKIEPVYERMKRAGLKITADTKVDPVYGFKSFSVEGPDAVAVEIVEEKPIPDGIWD
jgi:catechol 2,3-dioxygenase-like lactoylglutathione lyase family enzyme